MPLFQIPGKECDRFLIDLPKVRVIMISQNFEYEQVSFDQEITYCQVGYQCR